MHHSRLALFLYLPCASLLSHCYHSNLLASLVEKEHSNPVDTFDDLLSEGISLAIPAQTNVPEFMRSSPRRVVREVYRKNVVLIG